MKCGFSFILSMALMVVGFGGEITSTTPGPSARSMLAARSDSLPPLAIQVDGELSEPVWSRARPQSSFFYPWCKGAAPLTQFRALADGQRLYFAFEVTDSEVVVTEDFRDESTLDGEDRVELFVARDVNLDRYYCLEIDPLGRVHDYTASFYRKFDSSWNCPGLQAAGRIHPGGYTVEASIPLQTLAGLTGQPVRQGTRLRIGLFRADFRKGATGDAEDNWLSWTKPKAPKPDFHVPSAFAKWQVPKRSAGDASWFQTRGVVLVPEDIPSTDWPARAAKAGLTTIALHHGTSTEAVVQFLHSAAGREFLHGCAHHGLHVEYELHAMRDLLPRSLFTEHPDYFRMNERGERTADANLCVHSELALAVVTTNALRLAKELRPTTGRYFFWGDDGLPWCRCPRCRLFSDSEQAMILENHLVRALRSLDPSAQLAHLAYVNTLPPPTKVKPEAGIFLEFAPIQRRYDVPYVDQTGPEAKDALELLGQNLQVFRAETAQVLEYWLDVSRFSEWKRPSVRLAWNGAVLASDARTYSQLGIRHATTFAVWIDADYLRRFGEPPAVQEYGATLRQQR